MALQGWAERHRSAPTAEVGDVFRSSFMATAKEAGDVAVGTMRSTLENGSPREDEAYHALDAVVVPSFDARMFCLGAASEAKGARRPTEGH